MEKSILMKPVPREVEQVMVQPKPLPPRERESISQLVSPANLVISKCRILLMICWKIEHGGLKVDGTPDERVKGN